MSRTTTRFIGAAAALLAAGLAGFSLRAQPHTLTTVAARNPVADVRTQVIRRTVHIVRHEHGRHAAGSRGVGATGPHYPGSASGAARPVATHTSGSHYAASGAAVAAGSAGAVTTRTSASHAAAAGTPVASGAPVTTRTSASHAAGSGGSTSSGGRVITRTSSHGGSGSGSGGKVSTRSSGGGDGEGGDGGGNGD